MTIHRVYGDTITHGHEPHPLTATPARATMRAMQLEPDFAATPRGTGRVTRVIEVAYERELAPADLVLLANAELGITAPAVKTLRERHHALARYLASGMSEAEASALTGYSLSRISVLKADQSVKELIAFYREKKDAAFAGFQERAGQVALTALDIMADRLEEAPEDVTLGQALEITKTLADRTGHAPMVKTQNINVNLNMGDKLREARERAQAAYIDVTPKILAAE